MMTNVRTSEGSTADSLFRFSSDWDSKVCFVHAHPNAQLLISTVYANTFRNS